MHTTAGRAAAALWLRIGQDLPRPAARYAGRLAAVTGPWAGRFLAFDAALGRHHPAVPHHYLAVLAVRLPRQGRGSGTALLRAYHQILDHRKLNREGAPAYLEAAGPSTREFSRRHGYRPMPGAPPCLPDGGPPMWPMMRDPRPAAAS